MSHPSFGPVPPEEFERAKDCPYGNAIKIIRKYDPLFGRGINGADLKTFSVCVSRKISRRDHATVQMQALDEDHARELIDKMDWENFIWKSGCDEDEDDSEIDSVKEIKE